MKHGYCGFCNYGANELVFLLIRMWLPSVVGVHIRIRDGYSFIGLSINKQEYIISSEGLCFPLACCWVIVLLMKSSDKSCTNRGLMHAHTRKHTAINGQLLIHVQLYYIVPRLKKKMTLHLVGFATQRQKQNLCLLFSRIRRLHKFDSPNEFNCNTVAAQSTAQQ